MRDEGDNDVATRLGGRLCGATFFRLVSGVSRLVYFCRIYHLHILTLFVTFLVSRNGLTRHVTTIPGICAPTTQELHAARHRCQQGYVQCTGTVDSTV